MIPYPLTQLSRYRLSEAFKDCRRVDLGIDCLLEGRMGDVFVHDLAKARPPFWAASASSATSPATPAAHRGAS
jgi:hypothetical protein